MVKAPRSEREAAAEKKTERGRKKEGETLRIEEFCEGKSASDSLTVGLRDQPGSVCFSTALQRWPQVTCPLWTGLGGCLLGAE